MTSSNSSEQPFVNSSGIPADVLERFAWYGRETTALTVLFHSRVAAQLGLSPTDEKCLDLVMRAESPLTAGRIAELSGLSTGAVTSVIDRLEKAGFVRRSRDKRDRRKVLVEVGEIDDAKFASLFEGVLDSMEAVLLQFTPEEWAVLERYHRMTIETFRERVLKPRGL
ncbi:DNA-binding transcriptional regulator, MarR family [Amycolatopsis rubida]|uniref:DNA-binding transcriptional regulator, MarR family n=1 Tax=Amycolatopsis rubida TaxID=112413 RepID=A0A1I5TNG0_9PSEU|nr:DNA-binding transcriptional regulator, MarR family [Amycolatopsis rubida]